MRLTSLVPLVIAMAVSTPAAAADTLADVAAKAAGADGWRIETVGGGNRVALGIATVAGARHAVVVGCSDSKRPMLALSKGDRALIVDSDVGTWAFANGKAADALVAGLVAPEDKTFKLSIDDAPFPAGAAAAKALDAAGKDCASKIGWDYGLDDEQQLVWIYQAAKGEPPQLIFGKPSAGWLQASLTCDAAGKNLIVKTAVLPEKVKNGQNLPLTFTSGSQSYTASGRVELFDGGDVAGFLTGRFAEPRKLISALSGADTLTLKARDTAVTLPSDGAVALASRFTRDCKF